MSENSEGPVIGGKTLFEHQCYYLDRAINVTNEERARIEAALDKGEVFQLGNLTPEHQLLCPVWSDRIRRLYEKHGAVALEILDQVIFGIYGDGSNARPKHFTLEPEAHKPGRCM